ncbi:hypothetical protein ABC974_18350 [Sphingomonas oligophenolica]|uniref:Uncharacterized protein n=1 Tax=Sphingomonas oligophenolica TaxID=301154 RepID=A0ABU9Y715_9SPHN
MGREMLRLRSESDAMRKNAKARFLPIVMLPAIMPAVLVPPMLLLHVPDYVLGIAMGVFIGLAGVGIAWMAKS